MTGPSPRRSETAEEVRVEASPKRVRAYLQGHLVVDCYEPLLVWENPYYPTYYFPTGDVRAELSPSGAGQPGPDGTAGEVLDVATPGGEAKSAASRYPASSTERLRTAVRLDWESMDEWLEEDEPVYVHPRSPYTRVDILASSRHVIVRVAGVTIADSQQPRILLETGLPPRYYLPLSDYDTTLLRRSTTTTRCPYKGTASYFHVDVGGRTHEDLVWIYRAPTPECQKVAGLAAPYNERTELEIDGASEAVLRPAHAAEIKERKGAS